ncbi:hypothetical protein BGX34_004124, partial [Mortierella sp. NVP85]
MPFVHKMLFGGVIASPLSTLSPQQALELARVYLENAYNTSDPVIALVLCHDTEVSLSQAKKAAKHDKNQTTIDEIATAYINLGKLLEIYNRETEAKAFCKKGKKLGGNVQDARRSARFARPSNNGPLTQGTSFGAGELPASNAVDLSPLSDEIQPQNVYSIPAHIFAENVPPPGIEIKLPEADERLDSTQQLAGCLGLLRASRSPDDILAPETLKWLRGIEKDTDEQDRLKTMATEVIRAFKREEIKDAKAVAE